MMSQELHSNVKEEATGNTVCTCGRTYSHCHNCGGRNLYPKKFLSEAESRNRGVLVRVVRCKRCGWEGPLDAACSAPAQESSRTGYVAYQKPVKEKELMPWDGLVPGSDGYRLALNKWVLEMQPKKKWDRVRVYVEAKKAGFQIELYDMDDEIREALIDQGLLGVTDQDRSEQSGGVLAKNSADSAPDGEAPSVSLDEIIKQMQENSK